MEEYAGWIYILETSSDFNRYKVGMTKSFTPMRRVNELRCGDPNLALLCAYQIPVSEFSLRDVEWELHQSLFFCPRLLFHNGNLSEWFRVDKNEIQRHVYCFLKTKFPTILFPVFYEDYFDVSSYDEWPEFNDD